MVKRRSVEQQLFNTKVGAAKQLFQDDLFEVANKLRNIPVTLAISALSDLFKQSVTEGFHRLLEVRKRSPEEIRDPNPVRWAKKSSAGVIRRSTRSHPAAPFLVAQLLSLLDRVAAEEILRQPVVQIGAHSRTKEVTMDAEISENRARVDAFIAKLRNAGYKVTRTDIWQAAGYEDPTEFERFQRRDSRTTASAKASFNRVLDMNTEDFMHVVEIKRSK